MLRMPLQGMAADDVRYPKLSDVTLAFLEASCRRQGVDDWRMFDVVALMRQQKERARQARLPKPPKQSHHFADEDRTSDATEPAPTAASGKDGAHFRCFPVHISANPMAAHPLRPSSGGETRSDGCVYVAGAAAADMKSVHSRLVQARTQRMQRQTGRVQALPAA